MYFVVLLERDCLGNIVGAKVFIEVVVEVIVGEATEVVRLNLEALLKELVVLV